MQLIAENEDGFIGLDGNELIIGSKRYDPPKVRLTAPVNTDGGGGGVISFNVSRYAGVVCDGHQQDEVAMVRVEQAEDVRGQVGNLKAELNLMLADGSGIGDVVKVFACVWDAVTRLHPEFAGAVRAALLGGVAAPQIAVAQTFPNKLVSPDGVMELDIQNADAKGLVMYDTSRAPGDRAIWSASIPARFLR